MIYKILIVEDDKNISEFLVDSFKQAGYSAKTTSDGAKAIKFVKDSKPDLIVLDLGIENISGETVCEQVKKMHPDLPIIILTAKNSSREVVHGLDIGADDYVSKPFEIDELLARVRTRLKQKGTSELVIDNLIVDTTSYEVKRGGKSISLTAKEFKLLEYLIINKGAVLSRETILDHIWLYSPEIESRVVDVYIGYLRKKVDDGFEHKLIKSVRGFGYTIKE
jgi:two-component system response regulator ArlR